MATTPTEVLKDGTQVVRTNAWSPPGCHPVGCGLKLHVKDGKLVKVEGDENHPVTKGRLCPRCLALKEYIYHPDRVIYPQKRAGKRGEDKWEQITWDEAWSIIREKVAKIKEEYGPQAIVEFTGTGREASSYQHQLAKSALGTPNVCFGLSGFSCYGPRVSITQFVLGSGIIEIDYASGSPLSYDDPAFVVPEYILIWGKEPLRSNADGLWGHCIVELMKRGTKLIVADPKVTWLATRAEYILQLRPGTDTALALGILNVIMNEDLIDHEFVEEWCYGYEELKERVQEYPVSKVADITGVAEEDIIGAARALGKADPWSLCWGLACDENPNGLQCSHTLMAIAAVTGNIDNPGGTRLGLPFDETVDFSPRAAAAVATSMTEEVSKMALGRDEYPAYPMLINMNNADCVLEALETGRPYPVKMAWIQSSNILSPTACAQPRRWREAMQKLDFVVVTDLFQNPTSMALADLFLPVSTCVEHIGFVYTHYGMNLGIVGALNKVIEVGDCRSDLELLLEAGQNLNPEGFKNYLTPTDLLDKKLMNNFGFKYEDLVEQVVWQPGLDYYRYKDGKIRSDGLPGFNTPSGKIELYCTMLEALNDDALPYYEEPRFSAISRPDMAKEYPLTVTTGARDFASFHSEHRQINTLREVTPDPLMLIHPETAAEYGLKDGDWAWMENDWGKAKEKVKVTPIMKPGVISAAHGWWFPEEDGEEPNLFGVWKSNVNTLVPHHEIGKIGFGAYYKCVPCKMYKAE